MSDQETVRVGGVLSALYEQRFGGKSRGKFRISVEYLRTLFNRRRVYPETVLELQRAMYEYGYALVDMERYFVVLSHKTFVSCRRVNDTCLAVLNGDVQGGSGAAPPAVPGARRRGRPRKAEVRPGTASEEGAIDGDPKKEA